MFGSPLGPLVCGDLDPPGASRAPRQVTDLEFPRDLILEFKDGHRVRCAGHGVVADGEIWIAFFELDAPEHDRIWSSRKYASLSVLSKLEIEAWEKGRSKPEGAESDPLHPSASTSHWEGGRA